MFNPELPDITEELIGGIAIPDDVALAIDIEREERKLDFINLRKEINRVSTYGVNNVMEASYHTEPSEDGMFSVFFTTEFIPEKGRHFRIVTNNEYADDMSDGRHLEIVDYLVSDSANLISREYTWLFKHHHEHSWKGLDDHHGPIIGMYGGKPRLMTGQYYEKNIPSSSLAIFEEVFWRRDDAKELTDVLSSLNDMTCEDIII